jgi:hypothetical protein
MSRFVTLSLLLFSSSACSDALPLAPYEEEVEPGPLGLRAVGNRIEDADGRHVVLRGVNRSGTEYQCIKDFGDGQVRHFDGPSDAASIDAIASWRGVNAVRVPLNEHCWLGVEGMPAVGTVEEYRRAVVDYVALLHSKKLTPILDLHWVGAGSLPADRLEPMPDAKYAPQFWRSVAATFKDDPNVVLEPFNEPYPNGNSDGDLAWHVFRDGGLQLVGVRRGQPATGESYDSVGMQALVDAIRSTGARHLILVGGIQYSNNLERWLEFRPVDPIENLGAAWHVYDKNECVTEECWDATVAPVAAAVPLVTTEFGEQDCDDVFVEPLLGWLDQRQVGYLAWSWNAYGPCSPVGGPMRANPWSLVTDYTTGTPNGGYAQAVFEHLRATTP